LEHGTVIMELRTARVALKAAAHMASRRRWRRAEGV